MSVLFDVLWLGFALGFFDPSWEASSSKLGISKLGGLSEVPLKQIL